MAESGRTNRGGDRRAARAAEAAQHIAEVDARLSKDVARSLAEVRTYDATPKVAVEGCIPEVSIVDEDLVGAIIARGRGYANYCDMAVLDPASYTSPAGSYERGAFGQEQVLCAESTLYNVLREQKGWYAQNRNRHINCALYENRALVVPKVRFDRERFHGYADVIVVAPPNVRRAREDYHIDDETQLSFMRSRIRCALAIADDLGHDKLVFGAFGCDGFGMEASTVAELFRAELARGCHKAKQVTIAIPKSRFDELLPKFEHAFACFPKVNDAPYTKPEEKPHEVVKAEEDDEEEDWRKYL